ncbi:MAG: Ig-like domain-containing protein [Coriobacteriia bacterium]|nr:Ig-like domain-containing protein [Coriobacteriia bacterium]
METTKGRAPARLLVTALVTAALALGLLAATSLSPAAVGQAHAASISKKSVTLVKGKSCTLKVKGAKAKKVKWSSSKKSVATVSKKGVVKAKKPGKATITAKYKKKKFKCKVTVKAAAKPAVVFDSTLGSAVLPAEGDITSVITFTGKGEVNVSSSNPAVAKATWISSWANGKRTLLIEGLIPGEAVIKLTNTHNSSVINIGIDVEAWGVVSDSTVADAVKAAGENGKISTSGWHDSMRYSCAVRVISDGTLQFECYVDDATVDMRQGSLFMNLVPGSSPELKYRRELETKFFAEAKLSKNSYQLGDSLTWRKPYTTSSLSTSQKAECNEVLTMSMQVWSQLLRSKTGFDFSNLGFANL